MGLSAYSRVYKTVYSVLPELKPLLTDPEMLSLPAHKIL